MTEETRDLIRRRLADLLTGPTSGTKAEYLAQCLTRDGARAQETLDALQSIVEQSRVDHRMDANF